MEPTIRSCSHEGSEAAGTAALPAYCATSAAMSVADAMLTNQDGSEASGPVAVRKLLLLLQGVGEDVSSAAAGMLNAKGRPGRHGVASSVPAMWLPAVSLVVLISGDGKGGGGGKE